MMGVCRVHAWENKEVPCWYCDQEDKKMGNDACFLITVLYGDELIKCALKVNRGQLSGDVEGYPMEPGNRAKLHALLPHHVQSCGPIVAVDSTLFEVHSYT